MPAKKRCLGVDIGHSFVKIAEIIQDKDTLTINKLVREEVDVPLTATDEERRVAVVGAIRRALKSNKISTREAVFSIPGQAVIIRRVKLPRTTPEKMIRMVQYEAREQIPFPADISRLEYQVFEDTEDPTKSEVLMVAIRKDHLSDYLTTINKSPLKPISIGVSSLGLFNYHAFQYDALRTTPSTESESRDLSTSGTKGKKKLAFKIPKLRFKLPAKKGKKKVEPETTVTPEMTETTPDIIPFEEVKAYVNIGSSSFDLCIGRHGEASQFGFGRSVPRAGSAVTEEIRSRLNIDFKEAEAIKRDKVAILAGMAPEGVEGRGVNIQASEAATSAVDKIIADIRRSLDFYVSQPEGMMVDSISVSGGEALLPEFSTYLEERMGLPVDVVTKPELESLKLQATMEDRDITFFPIAIGLALQGLDVSRTSIDFLPPDLKVIREFKAKKPLVAALVGMLLLMIGISTMAGKRKINDFMDRKSQLEQFVLRNQQNKKEADEAEKNRKDIMDKFTKLTQIISDRDYWLEVMAELQRVKPADIWLELLVLDPQGNIMIVGRSESASSAADFIQRINETMSERFGEEEKNKPQIASFSTVFDDKLNKEVSRFEIRAKCKDKESVWQKPSVEERLLGGGRAPRTPRTEPGVTRPSAPPPRSRSGYTLPEF